MVLFQVHSFFLGYDGQDVNILSRMSRLGKIKDVEQLTSRAHLPFISRHVDSAIFPPNVLLLKNS